MCSLSFNDCCRIASVIVSASTLGKAIRPAVTSKVSSRLGSSQILLITHRTRVLTFQTFVSGEVGRMIGERANAPVYVLSDAILGTGAVGGAIGVRRRNAFQRPAARPGP
jgi:hypothetical protein